MAEEDVTDLTEGEEPEDSKGKKGKRKKKEKAPKEPKKSKLNGDKEQKVKGKGKGGTLGVIILMVLVVLLLVGGFGAALFFDVLEARQVVADVINDSLIDLVIWLDPGFSSVEARMRADAEAMAQHSAAREEELNEREEELLAREAIFDTLEAQVSRRETDLANREARMQVVLDRSTPLFRRQMTEAELEEMLSLSNTYSQMAPEVAARIMTELHDPRDAAGILHFMNERNRAAIMAVMDERFAAHVTEILLYY